MKNDQLDSFSTAEEKQLRAEKQLLYLNDLEDIDKLFVKIEEDISQLADRETKEIIEIEAMIEAHAEVDTDVGTGGLDKIVERDDEGGGE